ncbi:MAG TPA: MbcA/ParS/Xre antitoxin family protein [Ferrovibrio sp.]|uniref:MbcA/ParS/Xre antitoxin family protein n=1 Tax=Ferrovibrio sp. TaxID=1917215 RepID=UPI002ED3B3C6
MDPHPLYPTDFPSRVPNLADPAERLRLTPAAIKGMVMLAEIWRLDANEASALLGDLSERTWFRMKKSQTVDALSQDVLMRISLLIGIFKGLRLIFSAPLSDDWIRLPNRGAIFGGQAPLDLMIQGGIPAMVRVRQHIDALRGGL